MNPFLARMGKKTAHGNASEKRVAKSKLKSRLTPGSGALSGAKGDSVLPDFLVESKATIHDSFSVKKAWLDKITKEAMEKNRTPLLTVSFVLGSGEAQPNGDWVMMPMHTYQEHFQ